MKISFVGAGGVGCSTAFAVGLKGLFDEMVLIDLYKDFAIGKAMDLQQGFILNGIKDIKVSGTDDYSQIKNSDAIVITAGFPSASGSVTREQLLDKNKTIIEDVANKIKAVVPTDDNQPLIIIVTNPMDYILKHFIEFGGFNKRRTIGSGNFLDTARFKYYLSKHFNVPESKIDTYAVGQHGAKMVYLLSQTKINGVPLFDYMKSNNISMDEIKKIESEATLGSAEIITLIQKGGTFYGPAVSIFGIIDAVLNDKKKIFSVSTWLNGEYGFKGICLGAPSVLGKNGIEEVKVFDITEDEKKAYQEAYDFVANLGK